jgi:hypothetical protein
MIILPENLKYLDLCKSEKKLIRYAEKNLSDEVLLILHANPVVSADKVSNIFITNNGVFSIFVNETKDPDILMAIFSNFVVPHFNSIEEAVVSKLKSHKLLLQSNDELKFPVVTKLYFPNLKESQLKKFEIGENEVDFLEKCCLFSNFKKALGSNLNKYLNSQFAKKNGNLNSMIEQKDKEIIMQQIAPEYTIPKKSVVLNNCDSGLKVLQKDQTLKNSDQLVDALMLDRDQVNIVNNIKSGNQLILACAGSGKSVVLISKCFRMAKLYGEDKKFLLTCFNSNLQTFYNWQIDVAGLNENNVYCFTFHKLCKFLLDKNNIKYPIVSDFDERFEHQLKALQNAIKDKKIKHKFFGIFIDEVQIFKPEWYEICFNLLENNVDKNGFLFVIAGDISQSITSSIKRGKASWQGNPKTPNYRGRTIRIETNYRNTIEINSFINEFTDLAKKQLDQMEVKELLHEDLFLRGVSHKNGPYPKVITVDEFSNRGEAAASIAQINDLYHSGIPYSEIAIIMNHTRFSYVHNWGDQQYKLLETLKMMLEMSNIPFSEMLSSCRHRITYTEREGVTLITSQGALGLDFEGVIVCGLKTMGQYAKSKNIRPDSHFILSDETKDQIEDFQMNINALYTAFARATKDLRVILTETEENSIYSYLINSSASMLTNDIN